MRHVQRSALQALGQRLALQELHGNEELAGVLADFVDRHDIRVAQRGCGLGFRLESFDEFLRSQVGRLALQMMMSENGFDLFVHPENTIPTPKIQGPSTGGISLEGITPFLQIPRIVVPAGMNDIIYEPQYVLNEAHTNYSSALPEGTPQTTTPHPMPIAITFFANQGDEPLLITVGTAYEAATGHRTMPPDFGPLQ